MPHRNRVLSAMEGSILATSTFIECARDVATNGWKAAHIQDNLRTEMHLQTYKRVSSETSFDSLEGCGRAEEAFHQLEQEERPIGPVRMEMERTRPFAFSYVRYSFVLAMRETKSLL